MNVETMKTVTVVRSGFLPGEIDCHLGADEGRYLSNRGMVRGIQPESSRGSEHGDFDRFLDRLPNSSSYLTRGSEVELLIPQPQGGFVRAKGRPASDLVAYCAGMVDALAADALRKPQIPIAYQCSKFLAALAHKGIEAMVDEACGVVVRVDSQPAQRLLAADVNAIAAAVSARMEDQYTTQIDYACKLLAAELRVGLRPVHEMVNGILYLMQDVDGHADPRALDSLVVPGAAATA